MNKERIAKVLEVVTGDREHFDMSCFVRVGVVEDTLVRGIPDTLTCKTALCVAGWAAYLWRAETTPHESIEDAGRRILGLSAAEAESLFYIGDESALQLLEHWST